MKADYAKDGFTVIELMAGILASSVLILTVSSLLIMGWIGWRRNNESVNMQRDGSLAMRVIAEEIRKSGFTAITAGSDSLECVNPAGDTVDFTVSGGRLDMAVNGTFYMRLISGGVVAMETVKNTAENSVQLTLRTDVGSDSSQIEATVFARNYP